MKVIGELDNISRPTIVIGQPILIIPGADTPLTAANIQLSDTDLDPTKVYLYTISGDFHWKHDCDATAKTFSFFNIIHDDIVYHHQINSTIQPVLLPVNLNSLEVDFSAGEIERFVESILQFTESSPLLQYLRADSPDHINSEPIVLQVTTDELYTHVVSSNATFAHAPSPDEVTRVRAGEMGFYLTPKHLLAPNVASTYTIDPKMLNRRLIINVKTGETMEKFTQQDVNRLRLALVVYSHPLQTKVTPVGYHKMRLESGIDVPMTLSTPGSGQVENIT